MNRHLPWLLALLLAACASPGIRPPASPSNPVVDALLPSGRNFLLFDFTQSRYQLWDPGDGCRLADTLKGSWAAQGNWLALAAPGGPFAPVRAASGSQGQFFLLDRIGNRLCAYDTGAQFRSCFPLPRELQDRNPERLQVYRDREGVFTFLDPSEGAAWQFSEMRIAGGQSDWRLINRIRLPVNLEGCLWEPFFRNPCCRVKGRPDAGSPDRLPAVCFDKYFNAEGPFPPPEDSSSRGFDPEGAGGWDIQARPEPAGPGWLMVLTAGQGCAGDRKPVRHCFHSDKRILVPCPDTAEASGPPAP